MTEKLPNFFIIGAAKSGTTSLHEYLDQHPQIHMSFPKELNYFSFGGPPPDFSGPQVDAANTILLDRLRREKYEFSIRTWSEYVDVFARAGSAKALGESSVSYMYFPEAADRLRDFAPNARLIALLRDPVARAYSKYRQLRRDGVEPISSFEKAVAAEPIRLQGKWSPTWLYLDRGYYYRQLKRYYDIFDRSAIQIILYDDFIKDEQAILKESFAFLEVDDQFRIDTDEKHNTSDDRRVPRNMYLYALAARPNPLSTTVRALLPKKLLGRLRPIVRRMLSEPTKDAEIGPLSEQTREHLKGVFREDLLRLQDLIRRDLSAWL